MLNQLGANDTSCQFSRGKKNMKVGRKSNADFCVYAAKNSKNNTGGVNCEERVCEEIDKGQVKLTDWRKSSVRT